jgi:hypothetical protein
MTVEAARFIAELDREPGVFVAYKQLGLTKDWLYNAEEH